MQNDKKRKQGKRIGRRSAKQKNIIFVYEIVPPEKSLFPEKLAKANELLKDAILLP